MENKYISLDKVKRTPNQRENDMVMLQMLALLCGKRGIERGIDRVQESSIYKDNELYYQVKLFLLGQKQNFLKETGVNFKGKSEEEWMQIAAYIMFKNWSRYKNLKILKVIDLYCHDAVSRSVPGQDTNRFTFINRFYCNSKTLCNINVSKLLYDIVAPERSDTSYPNPDFDDDAAVEEFKKFTEALEKTSGVDEYEIV